MGRCGTFALRQAQRACGWTCWLFLSILRCTEAAAAVAMRRCTPTSQGQCQSDRAPRTLPRRFHQFRARFVFHQVTPTQCNHLSMISAVCDCTNDAHHFDRRIGGYSRPRLTHVQKFSSCPPTQPLLNDPQLDVIAPRTPVAGSGLLSPTSAALASSSLAIDLCCHSRGVGACTKLSTPLLSTLSSTSDGVSGPAGSTRKCASR